MSPEQNITHYRILSKLGESGMAAAERAESSTGDGACSAGSPAFQAPAGNLSTIRNFVVLNLCAALSFAQSLCPGSNVAPEKNGILGALQQASKLVPAVSAGARLGLVDLEEQGVCQYWLYLPEKRQKLIFADIQGTIRLTATVPMSAADTSPLPDGFLDLPDAVSAARKQGMQLPLDSAKLMMAQPRGKPAVAVWTLAPRRNSSGRVLSYFIAAADAGHPLALSDVTDYFKDYNAQWMRISDVFHSFNQQSSQAAQPAENSIQGQPCTFNRIVRGIVTPPRQGHWTWDPYTTQYWCK